MAIIYLVNAHNNKSYEDFDWKIICACASKEAAERRILELKDELFKLFEAESDLEDRMGSYYGHEEEYRLLESEVKVLWEKIEKIGYDQHYLTTYYITELELIE